MSGREVVLDTVVLSNFAATESIEILLETLGNPVTVPAVRKELEQGVSEGYTHLTRATARLEDDIAVIPVVSDERIAVAVDCGEAEALTAAMERAAVFASDDLPARQLAAELDVLRTGSLGILIDAVRRGVLNEEEADTLLQRWQAENGYHSPVDSISELRDD